MDNLELAKPLATALRHILRPLVRLLLRHGVGVQAFVALVKRTYVEIAMEEFGYPGKKQTVSRISTLTGLSRKEVGKLLNEPPQAALDTTRINRAARVIHGWLTDPDFLDGEGKPADLPFSDGPQSFSALVKKHSGDITARTISDELMRVGAIEATAGGAIRLAHRAYIPEHSSEEKLSILGFDVAALIKTIDHNLAVQPKERFFQRKVIYDNIPREKLAELRTSLANNAQQSLERMDKSLSQADRDANPNVTGNRRFTVGVGIYYFEDENSASN